MIALLVFLLIALVHPSLGSFWDQGNFWDQKADNCYYALRHRGTPSVDMFLKMQQWGTSDIWQGLALDEHDCHAYFDGCQTYSCVDEKGDQIFVVNSCVPDNGNCTHSDLDPICTKDGGTPKCEICYNGLCNKAKIELQKPLLKNVQKPNNPPKTGTGGAKNESSFEQNGMMTGAKNESSSEENGTTSGAKDKASFEENGTGGAKKE
uniref:Secreted protein n=1 Tax=Globodera pallida TaxID=36090 RepID=A0A183BVD0_GLOPA